MFQKTVTFNLKGETMGQSIITSTSLIEQAKIKQKFKELDDKVIDEIYLLGYWRGKNDQLNAIMNQCRNWLRLGTTTIKLSDAINFLKVTFTSFNKKERQP
jgi:hypothetical protein